LKILIVTYYAESHLPNSSAQNTRHLARGLLERGHEIRVFCVGFDGETVIQDGYPLTKLPIANPQWNHKWLGAWRPDPRIQTIAQDTFREWKPDILYIGAWGFLSEFVFAAKALGIPVVQLVHDYSILCLQQWLVDSWGKLCNGPDSLGKCTTCVRHGLGWKDKIKDVILSLPIVGKGVWTKVEANRKWGIQADLVVRESYIYMQRYRNLIDLFVAQSPTVIELLKTGNVAPSRCRFIPQYIGNEKLQEYPSDIGAPGIERPIRFVYIGRWSSEKGADLLLDSFLRAQPMSTIELWVVSHSINAHKILSISQEVLGSNKYIRLFDNVTGADVSKILALADVSIVPSICMELASRVVLEASAQNTPVIVSNTVGNCYVVEDGVNGRIFPTGDVNALKRCIEQVANNPLLIRDWALHISKPIEREEWLRRIEGIFDEAKAMIN